MKSNLRQWWVWGVFVMASSGVLAYTLFNKQETVFLIGEMTSGHHQIGITCETCHGTAFGGKEVMQDACVNCHADELKRVDDSHPKSKFTDPRNAARVEVLDARYCITCHTEHQPEQVHAMGVTLPTDFCVLCHADVANDRESHRDLDFTSCASAGCHNFHDNQALYEDFLVKHAGKPDIRPQATLLRRNLSVRSRLAHPDRQTLTRGDAPVDVKVDPLIEQQWAHSAHARGGINCSDCHQTQQQAWLAKPDHSVCANCHSAQVKGFLKGRHGMRLAQGLPPMHTSQARIPMREQAHSKSLDCNSCHSAHQADTQRAAIEACLSCHNDEHSLAYKQSSHYELWKQSRADGSSNESGVSCASCHLPRLEGREGEVWVEHNQNRTLRPNEKMLREVCLHCHGLEFSIDALADAELVRNNFKGKPSRHVPSVDWATARVKNRKQN